MNRTLLKNALDEAAKHRMALLLAVLTDNLVQERNQSRLAGMGSTAADKFRAGVRALINAYDEAETVIESMKLPE